MKSNFQVGDLVRVYGGNSDLSTVTQGVVTGFRAEGFLLLDNALLVHPKQCRKVVKKPRARIRVAKNYNGEVFSSIEAASKFGYQEKNLVEFVEARKKK